MRGRPNHKAEQDIIWPTRGDLAINLGYHVGKNKREVKAAKMPSLASPAIAAHGTPVPCMPVISGKSKWPHREKLQGDMGLHGFALVARPVRFTEVKTNKKAIEAMQKEWDSLRELGAWDE